MRFLSVRDLFADVMLSKLARWLRFGGIKTYDAPMEDDTKLLSFVKRKRGILITSDNQLFLRGKKRETKVIFVQQEPIPRQIAAVANALGTEISISPSIFCSVCSSKLVKVSKERLIRKVPEDAYKRHTSFYFCKNCEKVYWRGTHWKFIQKTLLKAKKIARKIG